MTWVFAALGFAALFTVLGLLGRLDSEDSMRPQTFAT